ncbi:2Fe-2S iron-sulfur cluster-binding protein [Xanthobacter autotrophicus]|jgi:2Fe-2S ferredoxin|uniref:2Fe-2S iron-sulfur cluster binding domain-containing protein n=1 Tax=Xanthobacter autotrophicus TaxID=280 RepID=A0A6C1KF75_XANAU|nr:2Fe-2S iron-sulfur cluster-binding protein [Xanthobacter autotrophicus]TLX42197.1 2Fe-2S iron-sulfur cluster binding domain-containing protein [Xanthobacter autotrophicus]
MTRITFVTPAGQRIEIDAENGLSVMECARRANVPGIVAECGGACSCATCHVHVDPEWCAAAGEAAGMERDMLEFAEDVRDSSRLSCQVKVAPALDGLVVHLPAGQG